MKTFTSILTVLALSATLAAAQSTSNFSARNSGATNYTGTSSRVAPGHDVTGFSDRGAPALNPESSKSYPNPNVVLKPKLGGVFVDGGKYGPILISPGAPAEYGMGEKFLSAPSTREDLKNECGRAAHHDAGGIKLFTLEF
jgi:hypothetical protein